MRRPQLLQRLEQGPECPLIASNRATTQMTFVSWPQASDARRELDAGAARLRHAVYAQPDPSAGMPIECRYSASLPETTMNRQPCPAPNFRDWSGRRPGAACRPGDSRCEWSSSSSGRWPSAPQPARQCIADCATNNLNAALTHVLVEAHRDVRIAVSEWNWQCVPGCPFEQLVGCRVLQHRDGIRTMPMQGARHLEPRTSAPPWFAESDKVVLAFRRRRSKSACVGWRS